MLIYLLFLAQLALIGLYDWIFFVNAYTAYPANCWWAFAFLHLTFVAEIVSVCLLRRMKQMPVTKKHPMWLFTITVGIQFLFAVVFTLVHKIQLKWVIILSASVLAAELVSMGVLLLVQKHREKKEDDTVQPEEEQEPEEEEPELPPPPKKIESTAMLLLMKFLANPGDWDVPEDFRLLNVLTEKASASTQYTYRELDAIEDDLQEQTNALKTYIQNKSMDRAKETLFTIMDILEEREKQITKVENPW